VLNTRKITPLTMEFFLVGMSGEGDNENVIKLDYADILETTELSALRF
jgi:hypothetical protein